MQFYSSPLLTEGFPPSSFVLKSNWLNNTLKIQAVELENDSLTLALIKIFGSLLILIFYVIELPKAQVYTVTWGKKVF